MLEARAFIDKAKLEESKILLGNLGAKLKGEYQHKDVIFASKDTSISLADSFLRIRVYSKNLWNEKNVVVAIKNTEQRAIGKNSIVPLKKEFDTEAEANNFVKSNLSEQFRYDYEFNRIGWQYDVKEDQVDLEDIEGHLSIELKSSSDEGLKKLVGTFQVEPILGPSVVTIKKLLQK